MTQPLASLEFLLTTCLLPGETSYHDPGTGKRARLQPQKDETILVFRCDSAEVRKTFDIARACDAIFFYQKKGHTPYILLVELKGKDLHHARDQLREPLEAIRRRLHPSLQKQITFLAVAGCTAVAPRESRSLIETFQKDFHTRLYFQSIRDVLDLRPYIS